MNTTEQAPEPSPLVETITAIEEGDLVVINDFARTWEVTDVVDRELADDPADARRSKRAVRLVAETGSIRSVFALTLEAYPDRYETALHVLATPYWYEEDREFAVEAVEILETDFSWVVADCSNGSAVFHVPDPVAAAVGEAAPICAPDGVDETDYRFVRRHAVRPARRACKDCARGHQPVAADLACPECDHRLGRSVVQGVARTAVQEIVITCPACGFTGPLSVAGAATDGGCSEWQQ